MHEHIQKIDPKEFAMYIRMSYSKGSKSMVHMEIGMVKEGDGRKEESCNLVCCKMTALHRCSDTVLEKQGLSWKLQGYRLVGFRGQEK